MEGKIKKTRRRKRGGARHRWTEEETNMLIEAVEKYGPKWAMIARKLGLRPEQCSNRYLAKNPHTYLKLSNDSKCLIRIMQIRNLSKGGTGRNWQEICSVLQYHSYVDIKNFGSRCLKRALEFDESYGLEMLANVALTSF